MISAAIDGKIVNNRARKDLNITATEFIFWKNVTKCHQMLSLSAWTAGLLVASPSEMTVWKTRQHLFLRKRRESK